VEEARAGGAGVAVIACRREATRALRHAGPLVALALLTACASDGTAPAADFVVKVYTPTKPVPDSLWRPPAGSTPATGNYVYLEMDPSLAPGVTSPHTIVPASGAISAISARQHLGVTATDTIAGLSMSGTFDAMLGMLALEDGYYPALHGPTNQLPRDGLLDVAMNGRGCATLSGWFAIDHVFYFNGNMTALDLRFEERCPGITAPMHGEVHWRE
jgi:hypothetical protein